MYTKSDEAALHLASDSFLNKDIDRLHNRTHVQDPATCRPRVLDAQASKSSHMRSSSPAQANSGIELLTRLTEVSFLRLLSQDLGLVNANFTEAVINAGPPQAQRCNFSES